MVRISYIGLHTADMGGINDTRLLTTGNTGTINYFVESTSSLLIYYILLFRFYPLLHLLIPIPNLQPKQQPLE
jgi:hypothetical protein